MKLALCAGKHQHFLTFDSIIVDLHRHACLKSQNNKHVISLQFLRKEVSNEVDFLHVGKYQNFLQVDTIFFERFGQACPQYQDMFAI